jgi:hypothetical protein
MRAHPRGSGRTWNCSASPARLHSSEAGAPLVGKAQGQAAPGRLWTGGWRTCARSKSMASLIGYHPVTDNTFVALVRAEDERRPLAVLRGRGLPVPHVVKVSWERALSGEPFNVDELLSAGRKRARERWPRGNNEAFTETAAQDRPAAPGPEARAPGVSKARASCPPGCTPMSEPQRALCRRYIKRLHRRLRGRGARKARQLVLLILEAIEWCRHDLTGTRQEVNSALEQVLGHHLPGGDRNIRDAMDLLVKYSLFAHLRGPPGCDALYVRAEPVPRPKLRADAQDRRRRGRGARSGGGRRRRRARRCPRPAPVRDHRCDPGPRYRRTRPHAR